MLRDWYQPECGSVWLEHKVMSKLNLVYEQQLVVDSGIRFD